ncbi:MAG: cyclic nucleotide-binding domain-containing protein [Streptosporangiales bacterium]|jgi:CRP-like cAMP-binding protein|nr:cyclic nucleotide-binding domain-containing protein [Streptosporangiales bacterium]
MASPSFSPGQSFLNSLTPSELRAFTAAAHERTFARGSTPMREGDRADYVMVILDGWVQISVSEDGRDRAIAKRGPGQLIGEVGILRINARSATVTVLETIRALVMRTGEFAGFLSDHQQVRAVVESQIDERLTERPYRGNTPQLSLAGENCTIIYTDMIGFGALDRRQRNRQAIRAANLLMMRATFGAARWQKCLPKDQGDGFLIVMPPDITTITAMECLHRRLPEELRKHNLVHDRPEKIRLRVAADVGPVMHDSVGLTGDVLIRGSRMLDAPVLREAMADTSASLGLLVSTFIYDNVISEADGWASPAAYDTVEARSKESRIPAWMRIFDAGPAVPEPRGPLIPGVRDPFGVTVPWSYA